jgi:hypothetical protein
VTNVSGGHLQSSTRAIPVGGHFMTELNADHCSSVVLGSIEKPNTAMESS